MEAQEQVTPTELVRRRRAAKIHQTAFAIAIGCDRTTLWRRESYPETAPEGWWDRYAETLRRLGMQKARQTLELTS